MKSTLVKTAGLTDVGLKREGNEDSFTVDDELGLYIVADGMGGHAAGEVASRMAVDLIKKSFQEWTSSDAPEDTIFGHFDPSLSKTGNYVLSSIRFANKVIHEMSVEHKQYHGMGTTVTVLVVLPDLIISANVGDSRIYLVKDGHIEKLSKDHTVVAEQIEMGVMSEEEAETSPLKHILTKNMGSSKNEDPAIFEIDPVANDCFVLCSDGLSDLVSDDEILNMVKDEPDQGTLCRNFVDLALKRGGHDNTTVVSVLLLPGKKK